MIQKPAHKNFADVTSNFTNEHLRILRKMRRNRDDKHLLQSAYASDLIYSKTLEVRALVAQGMDTIRSLIEIKLSDPEALIDPGLKPRYFGFNSYISHNVYLADSLEGKKLEHVVNHELSHYVRHPLKSRRFYSHRWRRNIAKYHLMQAAEEGTAEFLGCFLSKCTPGKELMSRLAEIRNIHAIKEFYNAIAEEARNPQKHMKNLDRYLKSYRSKSNWCMTISIKGIRTKRSALNIEKYNIGVMFATTLLAANGFDEKKTALEMLTHPNEDLIGHVFQAVREDDGRLEKDIGRIDEINRLYSNTIENARRFALSARSNQLAAFVQEKRK